MTYEYRVICDANHHGNGCAEYCRPRDDAFGHYACDGVRKVCAAGWTGDYCDRAVCLDGCDPQHGYCRRPNECKCRLGWQGAKCERCLTHPGCRHGICTTKPWRCDCLPGWTGLLCDLDLDLCSNRRPCKEGATCLNVGGGDQGPGYKCVICRGGGRGDSGASCVELHPDGEQPDDVATAGLDTVDCQATSSDGSMSAAEESLADRCQEAVAVSAAPLRRSIPDDAPDDSPSSSVYLSSVSGRLLDNASTFNIILVLAVFIGVAGCGAAVFLSILRRMMSLERRERQRQQPTTRPTTYESPSSSSTVITVRNDLWSGSVMVEGSNRGQGSASTCAGQRWAGRETVTSGLVH